MRIPVRLLASDPDEVLASSLKHYAVSAPTALEAMRRLKPDLVLVDLSLSGTNGIELIKAMKAEEPHLPILVISMYDETVFGLRALKAGALGYVQS
jgi:DNA-binding NarL/FixJ family response regulator